jgi:predicted membrane protein
MPYNNNRWERKQRRWEERKQRWEANFETHSRHGHIWTGLLILLIGTALLLKALKIDLPAWLLSWPMLIIVIGFFSGVKSGFRGGFWFFMMLVGGAFLVERIVPDANLRRFIWPGILILIGLAFIFRPRRTFGAYCTPGEKKTSDDSGLVMEVEAGVGGESQNSSEEFLDTTSIFGGIKKNILTKNFKGGDVTNIMGGTELNFSQADIKGEVILELTQIFGGTKLVVPADWDVKSDIVAVFGGIEDKRSLENISINPGKVLLLKGTSIFAGIEIRNF